MNVSLFDKALPSPNHVEGERFYKPFLVPKKGHPNSYAAFYTAHLLFGHLILEKCKETAEAILDGSYKKFDALVMNHGCQVTALQNYRLFKKRVLIEEARKVQELTTQRIAHIGVFLKNSSSKEPAYAAKRGLGMNIAEYLKGCGLDVEISPAFAQLMRFRILHSINGLEQEGCFELTRSQREKSRCEEPFTCYDPFERRVAEIRNSSSLSHMSKPAIHFDSWVRCLQIEEAREAVSFIRNVADDAPARLKKLLLASLSELKEGVHGVRLPQLYTGEAALKAVDGVVLVKNKLKFNGQLRRDTADIRVFVKMPEGRALSSKEVQEIQDDEPVVVLEGYILVEETVLRDKVAKLGVATLVKATLARCDVAPHDSYSIDTKIDFITEERLKELSAEDGDLPFDAIMEALRVIKLDHIYCNSMKEERPSRPVALAMPAAAESPPAMMGAEKQNEAT